MRFIKRGFKVIKGVESKQLVSVFFLLSRKIYFFPAVFGNIYGECVGLADSGWIVYAVAAMALFSAGNLLLKLSVDNTNFSKFSLEANPSLLILLAAGVLLLGALLSQLGLEGEALKYVAAFAVFAIIGFLALVQALKTGRVALVNAVLALSIVFVTALSAVFLGEKISLKEIGAMALAVGSIALLAS